jgi:hypothetical protein
VLEPELELELEKQEALDKDANYDATTAKV